VSSRDRERIVTIDYRGGLRYPQLVCVEAVPDRLGELLTARAPAR
jgi:hypothetical protein